MKNWTDDFTKFQLTGVCPACGKLNVIPKYVDKQTGQSLSLFRPIWKYDENTIRICTKCETRVPVQGSAQPPPLPTPEIHVEIKETTISEEPIGVESRSINNRSSTVSVTRTFSVSKEWSKSIVLEKENASTTADELSIGVDKIGSLGTKAEECVRSKYGITEEVRGTYSEQVEVTVQGNTNLRILFQWKKLWQHGVVVLHSPEAQEVQIPFRVVKGLTFDQSQEDIAG